jgi:hypothetical protein
VELQHHGIARISIEGDIEAGRAYIPKAQQLLEGLLNRMRLGGLSSGAIAQRLDDNVYAYARVAGSINAVRIVAGDQIERPREERVALGAPDFVSGIITGSTIEEKQDLFTKRTIKYLKRFYPTQQTAKTHRDLKPDQPQGIERLAVEPYDGFPELQTPTGSPLVYSQYTRLRPTMYSGKMKRVVQALMGFGKQLPRESQTGQDENQPIPDGEGVINVTRSRSIYAKVFSEMMTPEERLREKKRQPTRYERDVAKDGLQLRYDYRFMRTHGIYTAPDDTLWLVEIGINRGVLAMPLPLHPLTVRPPDPEAGEQPEPWKFYEALEELEIDTGDPNNPLIVRDEDGLRVLDEFGGFPTGESFPVDRKILDAMIRAGEVLELLKAEDMRPFYENSYYSSAMGWAFSESGKEAHNTAYYFGDDDVQRGVHYAANFDIGAVIELEPVPGAVAVAERAKGAASELENGADLAPILERKALRLSETQVRDLLYIENQKEFAETLNAMKVDPIAVGSAKVSLQREGLLINPGKSPPYQIKFHEPLLGFLLSHDFLPGFAGRDVRKPCDTAMHVFFAGEELKWVRYFFDPTENDPGETVESDFEECMLVGSWTRTTSSGTRAIARGFYTGDYDDREELAGSVRTEKVKSEAMGITSVSVGDDPSDIRRNYIIRTYTFKRRMEITLENGNFIYTGIAVPGYTREAYYMAHMRYMENFFRNVSYGYTSQGDPHSAEGWRCIVSTAGFAFWPADMEECGPGCETRAGVPVSPYNPRVARFINYDPFPCSDYTDRGPWVFKCDNLDALVYSVPLPPLPPTENETVPRKATLTVRLVTGGEPLNRTVLTRNYADASWALPLWFVPSPGEFNFEQFIFSTFSALGDKPNAVFDKDINDTDGSMRYGSPTFNDMYGTNTCYIGVL